MNEVYIYKVPLPGKIKGCVAVKDDDYIVFINESLSEEQGKKALDHELDHIRKRHQYTEKPAVQCEREVKNPTYPNTL